MSPSINFIALLGDSITEEFGKSLEDLNQEELADAAEDHFDAMSEEELRSLYRDGTITIDDALEEAGGNSNTAAE